MPPGKGTNAAWGQSQYVCKEWPCLIRFIIMHDTTEHNKNRLMSESDYIVNRRSVPGALCEGQAKG